MNFTYTILAAGPTIDPIGIIQPSIPLLITPAIDPTTGKLVGVMVLLNTVLRLIFVVAGLWGFLNLIVGGFGFMTAGGDPKAVASAWNRIWQSLFGLLIIVSSFLFAAIIGILLFKDPFAILQPTI